MSDKVEDLLTRYKDNVLGESRPRSIGLFPIPEYPEFEQRGMWSTALDVVLTTLRYLAPATLLTLFWGQQSFIFKLLKHIDSVFRAIVFSSEEQKRAALHWIAESGTVRVEHLDTVWRHGWILCGILDASLPGACAGHPPTRQSLKHAQTIADHYLGVEPVFSRQELESNDSLSRQQEWKLATYLDRIRQALAKLTPPVSRPGSQRTSSESTQITLDYVARGSGLSIAQIKNKMRFKIYPTSQQCLDPGEITVLIKGPKDTYGMTVIPPILGKAQLLRQKLLGLETKPSYTENALPITQGVSYLRAFGKNNMNKTYYIPKVNYDIEIEYESFSDQVKVSYMVNIDGKYQISITSRGQNIVGSPFQVSTSHNILKSLERDSFCLEDGEEIDIVDIKTDKKVVLRIVDFVTEKMLLKENGTLERINDDDAKLLMNTNAEVENISFDQSELTILQKHDVYVKKYRFKTLANKVRMVSKICKVFKSFSKTQADSRTSYVRPKTPQDIPDVVNSTFSDANKNPFIMEPRNTYIIPERLSVSIRSDLKESPNIGNLTESMNIVTEILNSQKPNLENPIETPSQYSPSNPFESETFETPFVNEKKYGTYVNSEYETNNSQIEEEQEAPIKIVVEANDSPIDGNPFIEDYHNHIIERPKTPILKIINGDVKDREDSVYVDPKIEKCLNDDNLGNEFINPFFIHHHTSDEAKPPVIDFIIGAPVSLPPILRSATPEPTLDSIMTIEKTDFRACTPEPHTLDEVSSSVFSTPLHTNKLKGSDSNISSTFHSLDSNIDANNDNHVEVHEVVPNQNLLPRKDIWDSAYVSIDDTTSSPDSNNNDNTVPSSELNSKQHFSSSNILCGIQREDLSKMGPAEKEIWQTCNELKVSVKDPEELSSRWDVRKPIFTPIIEESDRSLSAGLNSKQTDTDSVTNEFSEINDIYQIQFPKTENNSTNHSSEDLIIYKTKQNKNGVDSASVIHTDVKRQTKKYLEEAISEIQRVTESISASQALQTGNRETCKQNSETQFGDKETHIVLERKKYWDNRIQEIEAKSSEMDIQQKRRRLSTKHLRHNDSLTKRRGKQIAENGKQNSATSTVVSPTTSPVYTTPEPQNEEVEAKLVEKWKKYWDDKLVTEKDETDTSCFKSKSPKSKTASPTSLEYISDDSLQESYKHKSISPAKQELPEEVFRAFETSPKRFFGTSRKQILSKIDTFLGKPSTENKPLTDISGVNYETGLVSSRISLFHNISQSEDFLNGRRKCQSMHNISQRKDTEKKLVKEELRIGKPVNHDSVPNKISSESSTNKDDTYEVASLSFKERRARLMKSRSFNKTFDNTRHTHVQETENMHKPVQRVIREMNNNVHPIKPTTLRKTSISKSEMDIFNKNSYVPVEDYLDKYQSYDELPKVNVKNFISLYEAVSKTSIESTNQVRKISMSSYGSHRNLQSYSSLMGAVNQVKEEIDSFDKTEETDRDELSPSSSNGTCSKSESIDAPNRHLEDDKHSYVSLSDIEVEIIDNSNSDKSIEPSPERETEPHVEYKSRFKKAKEFFQSLEEITDLKKPKKLNECEQMLYNQSTEPLENERPQQRVKKNIKAHSVPSSEIAKVWTQLQNDIKESSNKLVKISEKFQVEDLFNDVVEGKLSRQGSLRGIPNKKAVLETFKSMENLTDKYLSPYKIAMAQLKDFTSEKTKGTNAQTYLNEYPYLPMTDPSKYQSRMDAQASGLITLKELLEIKKQRRNSVPDLRLNPKLSVEL